MAELTARPATGTVHWIGTGLSTGSGLRVLAERAARVVLYGRTVDKAELRRERLGLTDRIEVAAYDLARLDLRPGDVLVSMLPATEHAALLTRCLDAGAHFACSSYVSEEIEKLATRAGGLVVLTEAGLDPGIDHLFAHRLVARARDVLGDGPALLDFTSYCGGVPAEPNEFRYRFSWAPRGVLGALRSPARYVEAGAVRVAERPWEVVGPYRVGAETFETYPNRDSLPFLVQYGLPESWRPNRFVRGTLRLAGWSAAWQPVFAELATGDTDRIGALADELARRYPTTDTDRDRVVLSVALSVRADDGRTWSGDYRLDLVGDADETAMARTVSVPLAIAVADVLDGRMPAGLRRATDDPGTAARWLGALAEHGIECDHREDPDPAASGLR